MRTTIVGRIGTLTSIVLPLLAACSSMDIRTDQDPQANLYQYKTFAWSPKSQPREGEPESSILDQAVKSSVERELAQKGITPASPADADLLINYYGISQTAVTYGAGPPGYWAPYDVPPYGPTYTTREGSLTLQFIDPRTNRIVWQGTAADTISDAGASQKQVAKAVTALIDRFPTG